MSFSVLRSPRLFLAVFSALVLIVAGASGCSSSDEGSRQAGNLGTRVCILNSWSEKVGVEYINKDTDTGTGPLGPSMQSCAEGTGQMLGDVTGELTFPEPIPALGFSANNPWTGAPRFGLAEFNSNDPKRRDGTTNCFDEGFVVGDTRVYDNGTFRLSVKRLPDDQWKEFSVIIEPSQGQLVGYPCK
jgi:hypothetical protein